MLGYYSALEFLKRDWEVHSLSIMDLDLEGWYPKEIKVHNADVFHMGPSELAAVFRGMDAMVYAMGPDDRLPPRAPAWEFFKDKLVETSFRIFEAARDSGVGRAVLLGSYLDYFQRLLPGLGMIKRHPYIRARAEQSDALIGLSGQGMDVMVLELPYVFGTMPGRIPLWKDVFLDRFLKMNPVFYPDGGTAVVCVGSVGLAVVGAIEKGEAGRRYPIGDVNMRWREMFRIMFDAVGEKRRFIHIPHWVAALAGHYLMWKEGRKKREPGLHLAYVFKDMISREFFLDASHSMEELAYTPCDVQAAITRTARACYPDGYQMERKGI